MLQPLLEGLSAHDAETRLIAASETGELIATDQLSVSEYQKALDRLVDAAASELEIEVRESILNSVLLAASRRLPIEFPWEKLCRLMPQLEGVALEYLVTILGFSSRPEFIGRIEPFLSHGDEIVRQAATDALFELRQSQQAA